jgi:hypothetical protein
MLLAREVAEDPVAAADDYVSVRPRSGPSPRLSNFSKTDVRR